MQKIMPFLWFNTEAEEAAKFYTSIFKKSKINSVTRYGDEGAGPKGKVMTVGFTLNGQEFTALNGGPGHPLTDAVSFVVQCDTQKEVDHYWKRLTQGGKEVACGWLTDKYGLSWQIVPRIFFKMIKDPDPEKKKRGMMAMMKMVKLDIKELKEAYNQK
jgi:predicted 3-demethylubiquinone-9 3-methyltransferase (glyoxalase superfamily)